MFSLRTLSCCTQGVDGVHLILGKGIEMHLEGRIDLLCWVISQWLVISNLENF
jgi:hypothetical protein